MLMENTKVLLVDDEKLIRDGLKIILNTYDNIQVVGLCENGEVAYHFCKENDVDVILMDIRMPVLNGVEATKKIKSEMPHIKILILTTFNDTEYIYEGLKNGASGYMLKDSAYALIVDSILAAHKGNVVVHQEVANKIIESKSIIKNESVHIDYGLTQKDVNIIILIAEGLSNKEIAERLFLSEGTIKNNVSIILEKLDLRDRTQIAIFAYKNGMAK